MKFFELGVQLMKARRGAGCSRLSSGCCPSGMQDTIPFCPKKPFWNSRRALGSSLLTFGVGTYTGVYIAQNYQVPRVDDPETMVKRMNQKIRDLVDDFKNK